MKEKFIQKFLIPRIYNSLNKVKTGKIVIYNKDPLNLGNPSSKRIVNIHINNPSFFEKIIFKGGMGAAESYMNGDWSCDNLTLLMELLLENKEAMSSLSGLTSYFINSVRTIKNIFSYNYTKAAKKNVGPYKATQCTDRLPTFRMTNCTCPRASSGWVGGETPGTRSNPWPRRSNT